MPQNQRPEPRLRKNLIFMASRKQNSIVQDLLVLCARQVPMPTMPGSYLAGSVGGLRPVPVKNQRRRNVEEQDEEHHSLLDVYYHTVKQVK